LFENLPRDVGKPSFSLKEKVLSFRHLALVVKLGNLVKSAAPKGKIPLQIHGGILDGWTGKSKIEHARCSFKAHNIQLLSTAINDR